MPQHRMHYYMVSATIHYVRDTATEGGTPINEVPRQKSYNLVMQTHEKKITAAALNSTRQALFQRLFMEDNIPQDNIKNIIFNGIYHLGFMTQKEFEDMPGEEVMSH